MGENNVFRKNPMVGYVFSVFVVLIYIAVVYFFYTNLGSFR